MEGLITPGFQPLPECALVRIQGADAASFLHGQLTHGITGLGDGLAAPAAYCTAQGRLLANGVLWRVPDEGFVWMVSRDLTDSLLKRLRMFVLRAKVTISLDETMQVWGALGAQAVPAALHTAPAWTCASIEGADWIVAPYSRAERPAAWRLAATAPDEADRAGPIRDDAWTAARLAGGWPWIRAASQDQFLPASLDMDLNGTIDFAKGCYPGQEVIARSHYRGTVKRRQAYGTAPWTADAPALPADLYAVGDAAGRPVGRVIESAVHGGLLHVAAEITLSDWPAMRYAVGAPDGAPLEMQAPRNAV
ncbi:MAG: folate-binding protein [Castellaniella sp.]|uniref:CAF17-like 4Fe-4S cluster assembly/insertion protein YgfZ n=1 Tax=Castellaniella sp. TaxID=1955812 RepID=UPI003C726CF4